MKYKRIRLWSGIVFLTLGILLGFLICGLIIWGDLEATLFTDGINGDRRIGSLNCPVLITKNEIGTISVVVKNPAEVDSARYLRATISQGFSTLVRESKENVPIPAKEKKKVEWKIYPEDAAFERIVLFRLYIPSRYPYPSMSGSCGVVRLDFPWLNGDQLLLLASGLQVLFLVSGVLIIETGPRPTTGMSSHHTRNRLNGVYFLALLLIISAVFSYFGLWLLGMIGLAASLILAGVTLFRG